MTGLHTFLTDHGISTSELARLSGLSRQHIIRLKQGRGNPTERTMQRIAAAAAMKLQRSASVAEVFGLGLSESIPAGARSRRKAS